METWNHCVFLLLDHSGPFFSYLLRQNGEIYQSNVIEFNSELSDVVTLPAITGLQFMQRSKEKLFLLLLTVTSS